MSTKNKKNRVKARSQKKTSSSLSKLASITTSSLSNAYTNYRKNLEKKKSKRNLKIEYYLVFMASDLITVFDLRQSIYS